MLDDNEAQLIRQRVLSRTLEDFYDQLDEGRGLLADTLGPDGTTAVWPPWCWSCTTRSRATRTRPGGWRRTGPSGAAGRAALMTAPTPPSCWPPSAGRGPTGALLRSASARTEGDEALYRGYGGSFSRCLWPLTPWPRSRPGRRPGRRKRPSPSPAFHPRGRKDEPGIAALKQVWERCKVEEKKLAGLLSVSEEEAMEDLTAVAPAMVALLELTEDFAERYRQEKLRLNAADFSDQEHLTLGLLVGSGGAPTELGEQVAARYREILVDEYQDTNEIQNAIFRAVSKNGQNIFTVGT
ncbi:MAG: UvrD-helicase domain-containing protein [Dysosmobacter welbionis]